MLTLLLYMRRILDAFDCTIALVEVELTLQSGLKATAYRPKEEVIQEEPHSLNPFDSHHAGRWAENMCSFTWDPCEDLVHGHKATPRHMPAEGAVRIETTPGPQSQSVYSDVWGDRQVNFSAPSAATEREGVTFSGPEPECIKDWLLRVRIPGVKWAQYVEFMPTPDRPYIFRIGAAVHNTVLTLA